ncbi:MAG: hypothetical protein GWP38_11185, partial [Planctomycetia bacterium]|nr:hypothetical protein [Planctomycetia bacterium]
MNPTRWNDDFLWDSESARIYCESGLDVNERNEHGMTPLMLAAGSGAELDILKVLVDSGADIRSRDDEGWTPLMLASVLTDSIENIRFLIDQGSE